MGRVAGVPRWRDTGTVRRTRLALGLTLFVALAVGVLVAARPSASTEAGRSLGAAVGAVEPRAAVSVSTLPPLECTHDKKTIRGKQP